MRFRFCWDCDCPDWLLAEMVTISKLKPTEVELLSQLVVGSICGGDSIADDLGTAQTSGGNDTPAILAAIRWIIESAASSGTEPSILSSELQQLGLPKDHTTKLVQIYDENKHLLQEALRKKSLKASGKIKWSYDLKGLKIGSEIEPIVELHIKGKVRKIDQSTSISKSSDEHSINITQNQLHALLHELTEAEQLMEELTVQKSSP